MRMSKIVGLILAVFAITRVAYAADLPSDIPPLAPQALTPACNGVADFFDSNCTLSAYGVTFYGTVDMGVAWQSHGTPFSTVYTTGLEYLVSKNSNRALWSTAPNELSQSILGIKGLEALAADWSFVFDLEAGFDPYSLQLANGPKSLVQADGVPLDRQTTNGDSTRDGHLYNGLGYAGFSSPMFGTLTAGRQNTLTLDGVVAYDPQGASYAFSPIGYSGVTSGAGDTEDAKFTTSVKYKVEFGQFRAAALTQFGGYGAGNAASRAYQIQMGGSFLGGSRGKLSVDAVYSYIAGAVSSSALSIAQTASYPGTLAATLSTNVSEMLLAKYARGPATILGGYEHILYENTGRDSSSFIDIGGYTVEPANVNTLAFTHHKNLHIFWAGLQYRLTPSVDLTTAYYQYIQPHYPATDCASSSSPACSGALHAVSAVLDWRILPKLDAYSGVMFSSVENGLASGYLHHVSVDPSLGVRFRF